MHHIISHYISIIPYYITWVGPMGCRYHIMWHKYNIIPVGCMHHALSYDISIIPCHIIWHYIHLRHTISYDMSRTWKLHAWRCACDVLEVCMWHDVMEVCMWCDVSFYMYLITCILSHESYFMYHNNISHASYHKHPITCILSHATYHI